MVYTVGVYDESSSDDLEKPYAVYMTDDDEVGSSNNLAPGCDVENANATRTRARAKRGQKGGHPTDDELAHNDTELDDNNGSANDFVVRLKRQLLIREREMEEY